MNRCLRSRNMLTDQEENAVEVTANSVTQENTLGYELELSTTNMETY